MGKEMYRSLLHCDEPIFPHAFQFPGHGTAVHRQVICQVNHCEWKFKGIRACIMVQMKKIAKQFVTNGTFGEYLNPLAEQDGFF